MHRPLIAISASIEPWPQTQTDLHCIRLSTGYTDAVYSEGGRPVILPVVADAPADLLDAMNGLILAGGGDVDPALYGEVPEPAVYGIRPDRDAFEAALYREALGRGLPILAICRGMQLVNVLRGGSLVQNLTSDPGHWQQTLPHNPSHEIDVAPGSRLAKVLGAGGTAQVNSYHHQGLRDLGTGLRPTAMCGDVVEAVEAVDADMLGVQWHPEQMFRSDPLQRAIFREFVERAALKRPRRPRGSHRS